MYYGDKQDSLIAIMHGLQHRGWLIYGYKADMSDCMTDYYDPARWGGVAVKNGYILVVDCYSGGTIGGSTIHQSYDAKIQKKLQKLYALRDNHAASEGEKSNAQTIINSLSKKVVSEIVMESELHEVSYQKNPGNTKWHIERDDKIIGKGTGVFSFNSLFNYRDKCEYQYAKRDENSSRILEYYHTDEEWNKHYAYTLKERQEKAKLLNKYEALLNKWDSLVVIRLGDGDEDALIQKTIAKKSIYYIAEISNTPTDYVQIGSKWRSYRGIEKGFIYKVKDEGYFKLTPQWITLNDGKSLRAYKPEPNKSTKRTFAHIEENDFVEGHVVYIKLMPKEEIVEEVVWVRKSKTKKPVKKDSKEILQNFTDDRSILKDKNIA